MQPSHGEQDAAAEERARPQNFTKQKQRATRPIAIPPSTRNHHENRLAAGSWRRKRTRCNRAFSASPAAARLRQTPTGTRRLQARCAAPNSALESAASPWPRCMPAGQVGGRVRSRHRSRSCAGVLTVWLRADGRAGAVARGSSRRDARPPTAATRRAPLRRPRPHHSLEPAAMLLASSGFITICPKKEVRLAAG